jgi:hypothetical protein
MERSPEVKLIYSNTCNVRADDDPLLPYRMEFNLRPPELMAVAFVMMYGGSEEGVAKGKTVEDLVAYAESSELADHPRLRWIRIKNVRGEIVRSKEGHRPWVADPGPTATSSRSPNTAENDENNNARFKPCLSG